MSWELPETDFPPFERLQHMSEYVWAIRYYLSELSPQQLASGRLDDPACISYLNDLSDEAQRVPEDWKRQVDPSIDWERWNSLSTDLQDRSRHPRAEELWKLAVVDLDPLEAAIDAMTVAHGPIPRPPPRSS